MANDDALTDTNDMAKDETRGQLTSQVTHNITV
uniref:Uncharacterized protein n=1 Tax=Arundo donax TaxID=35708 RepID=A0A0A9HHK7_ARUDO